MNGGAYEMQRKKILAVSVLFILLMGITLVLPGCGGDSPTTSTASESEETSAVESTPIEPIELILHHHDPQNSVAGVFLQKWADDVTAASNGLLKVTAYHGGVLGTQKDMYDMLKNGTIDIAWGSVSASAGNFPMSEVFTLPMLGFDDAMAATSTYMDLWEQTDYLQNEYSNFHVILLHTFCDFTVTFRNEGVAFNGLSDIKGKNIRTVGTWVTQFCSNIGASPVTVAASEVYSSLEKGLLDGAMLDWNFIRSYKIYEQCKTFYDTKLMFGPDFLIMNKDTYETLPEEAKTVIDAYSGKEKAIEMAQAYMESRDFCLEEIPKNGGAIIEPNAQLMDELNVVAKGVWDTWVQENTAKALPAQEVFDFVKASAGN
jgi:TRAP-type C4-dicarboxylate transport system substrate-binding protein